MNQPKFKFGDKVFCIGCDALPVRKIEWNSTYKQYEYNSTALEAALTLYVEPKKKKLYAYTDNREVKFASFDNYRAEFEGSVGTWFSRAPEFDIEYPEAK